MIYDYLIIGSGLYGSIFAHEMNKFGKKCLVIEKRNHIGGNCYTECKDNINIHKYGPHIFHTNDKNIWNWINQFTEFHTYKHSPKINYNNKIYSFPINLMTLNQLWGINTPEEARDKLNEVKIPFTRICEHKHFEKSISSVTWITKEYSLNYDGKSIPYYPINDSENNDNYYPIKIK